MSLFPLSDLLEGTKRLFTGVQGKKSDGNMIDIGASNDGYLNVQDINAKTELELVKAELEAIKNKLNGTLDTQVTGSIVEISNTLTLAIEPGLRVEYMQFNFNDKEKCWFSGMRSGGSAGDLEITVDYSRAEGSFASGNILANLIVEFDESVGDGTFWSKGTFLNYGRFGRLRIRNKSTTTNVTIRRIYTYLA